MRVAGGIATDEGRRNDGRISRSFVHQQRTARQGTCLTASQSKSFITVESGSSIPTDPVRTCEKNLQTFPGESLGSRTSGNDDSKPRLDRARQKRKYIPVVQFPRMHYTSHPMNRLAGWGFAWLIAFSQVSLSVHAQQRPEIQVQTPETDGNEKVPIDSFDLESGYVFESDLNHGGSHGKQDEVQNSISFSHRWQITGNLVFPRRAVL